MKYVYWLPWNDKTIMLRGEKISSKKFLMLKLVKRVGIGKMERNFYSFVVSYSEHNVLN